LIEEHFLQKRLGSVYDWHRKTTALIIPKLPHLVKLPLNMIFRLMFNYHVENKKYIYAYPQFFMIAGHKNYLDPFFMGIPVDLPVNFVTTFEVYRKKITAYLFNKLFCIPKKRYLKDSNAVRHIVKIIQAGGIIAIFPEGERSWTGAASSFKPEVLKLLKKYNHIPILPVRIEGNYGAWPRWGRFPRRSPVSVVFQEPVFISQNDRLETVEDKLKRALSDQVLPAAKKRTPPAAGLEKIIYRCPFCGRFDALRSAGNSRQTCIKCSAQFDLQQDYTILFGKDQPDTRRSIDDLYREIMIARDDIERRDRSAGEQEIVIHASGGVCLWCELEPHLKKSECGRVRLTNRSVHFEGGRKNVQIGLDNIRSATIEGSNKLQVYDGYRKQLYQFVFNTESALKWQDLICTAVVFQHDFTPNCK
jgi:1-acyl-sn-glycerol-3-phosphate acyltransferase